MVIHFKVFLLIFSSLLASAATISGGRLVEDFSTDDYADYPNTTGLWNLVTHAAESKAVVAGSATSTMSFGDGSDGILDTSNGYTFDTNAKPNGYQFKSVNISAGTVTATGRNPLIIRSLTTINITPNIDLKGSDGTVGVANATTSGSAGASAKTCVADGGSSGGATTVFGTATAGNNGITYTAANGTNAGGAAVNNVAANAAANAQAQAAADRPPAIAVWESSFNCGTGGAGGGGHSQAAASYGTGGSGGASGGAIRLLAPGNITIGTSIDIRGGDGAAGSNAGAVCGGNGGGGTGGAAWLQSLSTINAPAFAALIVGGSGGNSGCAIGAAAAGLNGRSRVDGAAVAGGVALNNSTTAPANNQTYYVYSKAYDLGTLNASFDSQASISSISNSGSVAVEFAGSSTGTSFSNYTSDLTSLSKKNYRYLKFRVAISTLAAATTPQVSQIALDYKDAGLEKLDLKLAPGCGSIKRIDKKQSQSLLISFAINLLFLAIAGWLLRIGIPSKSLRIRQITSLIRR